MIGEFREWPCKRNIKNSDLNKFNLGNNYHESNRGEYDKIEIEEK